MRRSISAVLGVAAGGHPGPRRLRQTTSAGGGALPTGAVTLTMAGWSLSTTPEFKTLADGFHAPTRT